MQYLKILCEQHYFCCSKNLKTIYSIYLIHKEFDSESLLKEMWFEKLWKLVDLKGYELKVGFYSIPSIAYVIKNHKDHPVKIKGAATEVTATLPQVMNFKVKIPIKQKELKAYSNDTEKITGIFRQLKRNEIRFIAIYFIMFY